MVWYVSFRCVFLKSRCFSISQYSRNEVNGRKCYRNVTNMLFIIAHLNRWWLMRVSVRKICKMTMKSLGIGISFVEWTLNILFQFFKKQWIYKYYLVSIFWVKKFSLICLIWIYLLTNVSISMPCAIHRELKWWLILYILFLRELTLKRLKEINQLKCTDITLQLWFLYRYIVQRKSNAPRGNLN